MAEKYTYKDVIIDPEDPRVEIGKEYYFGDFPKEALEYANKNGRGALLEDIDLVSNFPFLMENFDESAPCLIRKKEAKKKYVPFDLDDPIVRQNLKLKWIRRKDNSETKLIWWFWRNSFDGKWVIDEDIATEELLSDWVFDSDGSPCGKLVEE